MDVLNGIAYDAKTGRVWLTGKNWAHVYQVSLLPVSSGENGLTLDTVRRDCFP